MAVKTFKGVLLRYAMSMVALLLVCWLATFAGYVGLVQVGRVISLNAMDEHIAQAVTIIEKSDSFSPANVPKAAQYAHYDKDGYYIDGSEGVVSEEVYDKAIIKGFTYDNGRVYTKINRDDGTVVLIYSTSAQFANETLRKLFPSADAAFVVMMFLEFAIVVFARTRHYGKLLAAETHKLEEVTQKIKENDLAFSVSTSSIGEIDQVLEALVQLRDALCASLGEQWQAQARRKEELASLCHDIKTPLSIARGNAELLQEDTLTPEQRESCEYIVASTKDMEGYLDALMHLSRAEADTHLFLEEVDAATWLEGAIQDVRGYYKLHGVTLWADTKGVSCRLQIDEALLSRALENILVNACEHSSTGASVCLNARKEEVALIITVQDEGAGFSEDALQHATEAFYMEDTSRSKRGHYGLGLYSAAQAIHRHEGSLRLSNAPEGGARVTVVLPLEV